ncbi:hypothetical protein GGI07_000848 [Coemansia sp. Benny D115]|nr:hypothetical protein GGI07_000848 [Coemansia sp. Benny D115]
MGSSYLIGLTAAVVGNIVIGTGQCLQKHGLNQLQREWEAQKALELEDGGPGNSGRYGYGQGVSSSLSPSMQHASTALDIRARSGSVALAGGSGRPLTGGSAGGRTQMQGPRARYTSKAWVAGVLMNYAGEMFGNSLALSYLSASVVAPVGIISVLVNVFLAERFLGERVTRRQRMGFLSIMAGVGCILLVAPSRSAAEDARQFVDAVSGSGVLGTFAVIYMVQAALISVIRAGNQRLILYAVVSGLFGAMNVMTAKMLTMFVRLRLAFGGIPHPADIAFYGAAGAASAKPLVWVVTGPQFVAAVCMAASIAGQELARQQALGRFAVMQVQPVFFATFNVTATLAGLLLFRELDGWAHALRFFAVFAVGIALIANGARYLPRARSVELPSHIRLRKNGLGGDSGIIHSKQL